jgi:hypothetical protein
LSRGVPALVDFTFQSSLSQCFAQGGSPFEPISVLPFLQKGKCLSPIFGCSRAWAEIQVQFGAGLNLKELTSVTEVLCFFAALDRPPRDVRRSFSGLISWYDLNWFAIAPLVKLVQLRDAKSCRIDGPRELHDRYLV